MQGMKLQEVQMIKVLTSINSEITNVDDAFFNKSIFGGKSGVLPDKLNECAIFLSAPNIITLDTGELLIYGVRVRITEAISFGFTGFPSEQIDYNLIAEVKLMKDKTITCDIRYQTSEKMLSKEPIYKNGSGIYQVLLCKFSHLPSGKIANVNKKLQIINSYSSGGIQIGTVTAETLPTNSPAKVKVENVFSAENALEEVNFDFKLPRGEVGPPIKLTIGEVKKGNEPKADLIGKAGEQILNLTLPKGDKGIDGVLQKIGAGYFALSINDEGNLILSYIDGDIPPDLHINTDGHLVLTI